MLIIFNITMIFSNRGPQPLGHRPIGTSHQISSGITLEIKCTINVMHLNHPETIPTSPIHGENPLS